MQSIYNLRISNVSLFRHNNIKIETIMSVVIRNSLVQGIYDYGVPLTLPR